jgi:hypothetical protein
MCATVWSMGFFESESPPEDNGRSYPVPDLITCVRADGRLGVFPVAEYGEETCRMLGLAEPDEVG